MLSGRAIALQGVGFGPRAMALQGFASVSEEPAQVFISGGGPALWVPRPGADLVDERRRRQREDDSLLMLLM